MNLIRSYGLTLSAVILSAAAAAAGDVPERQTLFRFDGLARIDWQDFAYDGHTDDATSGFRGKYLMVRADGRIAPGLTYSWRQRINQIQFNKNFFEATDWVYLNYTAKGWNLQAGKQIVDIGGYEYDRHPADLYGTSVFWNNVYCYQFGASVGYSPDAGDRISFQVCQSPFRTLSGNNNTFAYNLMWNGSHGCFDALWTANMMEYAKGRYINYISLGNKLTFGPVTTEIDLQNRYATGQTFLFRDFSVIGDVAWQISDRWRIHAKYTYDRNKSGTDKDLFVFDGTNLNMAGGGVEFFPLRKDRTSVRLHATAYYSWGHNANAADPMQSKTLFASVGLTWNMNFLNIRK